MRENLRYFARDPRAPAERGSSEAIDDGRRSASRPTSVVRHALRRRALPRLARRPRCSAEPELLVLDEPTVGLDPVLRRDLWQPFHELADDGTTLLVSSHVMDEADRCDELLLLRDGARRWRPGTPDELLRSAPAPTTSRRRSSPDRAEAA